jgi:hypothetical protein
MIDLSVIFVAFTALGVVVVIVRHRRPGIPSVAQRSDDDEGVL